MAGEFVHVSLHIYVSVPQLSMRVHSAAPQYLALSNNKLNGSFPSTWILPRSLQIFRIWCGP